MDVGPHCLVRLADFLLGLAHLNLGNPAAAIEPIRRAISLSEETVSAQDSSWFHRSLAIAYQGADQESDAVDAMLKAFPRDRQKIGEVARTDGWHSVNLAVNRVY
jgi:tetratricopeptide (TPR) repeat protein